MPQISFLFKWRRFCAGTARGGAAAQLLSCRNFGLTESCHEILQIQMRFTLSTLLNIWKQIKLTSLSMEVNALQETLHWVHSRRDSFQD